MKQKIRFRMRWREEVGYDDHRYAISPDLSWTIIEWQRFTGMTWWPVVGRRVE